MGELCEALETSPEFGLDASEAKRRLKDFGLNQLEKQGRRSGWAILIDQFKGVILWVLAAALVVAVLLGAWPEAAAILAVMLVNTLIGFGAEWRATRTIDALQKEEQSHVRVLREGGSERIPIRELVTGDVIEIEAREVVPADARIIECNRLRVNEAALNGESEFFLNYTR
ncbi:MAG: cation-transporting P-type ATPase [Opitutales bacterium]